MRVAHAIRVDGSFCVAGGKYDPSHRTMSAVKTSGTSSRDIDADEVSLGKVRETIGRPKI